MDIVRIQEYLRYEPWLKKDPVILLEQILEQARYLSKEQKNEVRKTYEFAKKFH